MSLQRVLKLMLIGLMIGLTAIACKSDEEEEVEDLEEIEEIVEDTTEVVVPEPQPEPEPEPEPEPRTQWYIEGGNYTIQVGAFRNERMANNLKQQWERRGYDHLYVRQHDDPNSDGYWWKTYIGRFASVADARTQSDKLNQEFNDYTWVLRR